MVPPQSLYVVRAAEDVPVVASPDGYFLQVLQPADESNWVDVMDEVFPESDNEVLLDRLLEAVLDDGLFVAIHTATGRCAGTAAAVKNSEGGHHYFHAGGEVGQVAVREEDRRLGVGAALCAAVMSRLLEEQCRTLWAGTRDDRLAAIRLFLGLGFLPLLYRCQRHEHEGPDALTRWKAVCERLPWPFQPDRWPTGDEFSRT